MSQFYTKDQIDQIASVIGTRIKENSSTRLEPAEDISSFIAALDGLDGLDGLDAPTQFLNIPMTTPTIATKL